MSNKNWIQKIGLDKKQAQIFLCLLQNEPMEISRIARLTKIKRPTVNYLTKKMLDRGLVKSIIFGKRIKYDAEDPKIIRDKIKKQLNDLDEILPELKVLKQNKSKNPQMIYFEGKDKLKKCYDDVLAAKTNLMACSSPKDFYNIFGKKFARDYVNRRVNKKIFGLGFAPNDQDSQEFKQKETENLRKVKLIDEKKYPITMEINIYDDKVMLASLKETEPFGAIIKSQELAKTLRSIFRLAWDNYPKDKKIDCLAKVDPVGY